MKLTIVLSIAIVALVAAEPVPITWEDAVTKEAQQTTAAAVTDEIQAVTDEVQAVTTEAAASEEADSSTAGAEATSAAAEATTAAPTTAGNPTTPAAGTTPPPPPPSTGASTSEGPTTGAPTSEAPTTGAETTAAPTTEEPTTTAEPETTTTGGFVCPEPNGKFSDPEACEQYYECKDGVPTHKICPARQMFNGRPAYRKCTRGVYFIDFDQCKVNDWTGFIPGRK